MNENQEASKPQKGTWANLNAESTERYPKLEFDINISKRVVFTSDEPREYQSKEDESVYYIFECEENAQPKVIMTSAWSLLKGLKALSPLAGKQVEITKRLIKGKQQFEVKLV